MEETKTPDQAPDVTPEQFYRLALTEPYKAIETLPQLSALERATLTTNVYMNIMWISFGFRTPTRGDRRHAVNALCKDLGHTHRREIKALVNVFEKPEGVFSMATASHAHQLMVHISAAAYVRAEFDEEMLEEFIAQLLSTGYINKMT